MLETLLLSSRDSFTDFVFTTGGTGLGPRDFTPDVITAVADGMIPGIMDHIRLTYAKENRFALLSRSVAAVMDSTFVFSLPGSVKAVSEYMGEILPLLEHMILMRHGIGHQISDQKSVFTALQIQAQ